MSTPSRADYTKLLLGGLTLAAGSYLVNKYMNCRCHYYDENSSTSRVLTQKESEDRFSIIKNVRYNLNIEIVKNNDKYNGVNEIYFDCNNSKDVFIDFTGYKICKLIINSNNVTSISSYEKWWNSQRINIPKKYIKNGQNSIIINYINLYDHTGDGLHQFIDPIDNQEYLYTNFEPFCAHRLLPCFDQPDIKGRLELSVSCPDNWSVFANEKEAGLPIHMSNGNLLHRFHITPPISTYLFAMVAGPYYTVYDQYDNGRIPLTLSCRASLKRYMDYEELFTITKQGFEFYENFFQNKYPFSKYDQIFVAEYNMGAMENVGCVTYNEVYLFRQPPTLARRAKRADTFLHEMSHMWFGNLVTCKWWDGLWLNESFATYISSLCGAESTKFGRMFWLNFNSIMKNLAYREDQLSTTHPVAGIVNDTDAAVANFDGLTYGKGASLLKQLVFTVGLEGFKNGMRHYFAKYQWGNTTLPEFLDALQFGAESVNRPLNPKAWSAAFLETAGLNTVVTNLVIKNNLVVSVNLEQTASTDFPIIRPHLFKLAVYDHIDNKPVLRSSHEVTLSDQHAVNSLDFLVNKPVPAFIFANDDDFGYIKCLLDPYSLQYSLDNLHLFSDDLLRQLIWQSLWNMVRDARMKSTDFLQLCQRQLSLESNAKILGTVVENAMGAMGFVPNRLQDEESIGMFNSVLNQLLITTDEQLLIVLAGALIFFARTKETVAVLIKYLDEPVGTFKFGLNHRWSIIIKAATFGLDNDEVFLKREMETDKSDVGQRAVLEARTAAPNAAVKEAAWKRYHDPNITLSAHQIAADMNGFHGLKQTELTQEYGELFFNDVRNIFQTRDKTFAEHYFDAIFPMEYENDLIFLRAGALIAELESPKEDVLRRQLQETIDTFQRVRECRRFVGL